MKLYGGWPKGERSVQMYDVVELECDRMVITPNGQERRSMWLVES